MHDELGKRMKENYESRTKSKLPRRTNTIVRLDGKAFHTFTKGFDRPFDGKLILMMDATAQFLCENVQGCKFAYIQSDEISLLLTDYDKITSEAYFDGNIQKIASITASMATAKFNQYISSIFTNASSSEERKKVSKSCGKGITSKIAMFDSRVFTIPDKEEVINYFIWRQNDAVRNSIQMVAQSLYSHKQLHGKNQSELQDMIHDKGQNWNNYPIGQKRGRCVVKEHYEANGATRSHWTVAGPPNFTQDRDFIGSRIHYL